MLLNGPYHNLTFSIIRCVIIIIIIVIIIIIIIIIIFIIDRPIPDLGVGPRVLVLALHGVRLAR